MLGIQDAYAGLRKAREASQKQGLTASDLGATGNCSGEGLLRFVHARSGHQTGPRIDYKRCFRQR